MKTNKKEEFERIFYELFPKVKAFASKILKSEEDAEDIAQDIFAKLWNMPEMWEKDDKWHSYVYTMARNHIFNFLKHKAIEQKFQLYSEYEYTNYYESDDIHDQLYANELRLIIMLTINRMPERRRNIFWMSREKNMSHIEIAEKLDISVRTVERHIYLALGDLKKVLSLFILFWLSKY